MENVPTRSKYGNKRTAYAGRIFSSQKEADWAARLNSLKLAKDPKERVVSVEYQYKMPLVVNGVKIADYYADFKVEYADGRIEIQDTKGMRTDIYKLKKKLVKALYGVEILEP